MNFINSNQVICFGEILWDMLPEGAHPGGAPMNVAIHLKKQGLDPILVSRIGKDDKGEKLRKFLEDLGLNLKFLQVDEKFNTSQVLVHLDQQKNATYEICEPVAWDNIQYSDKLQKVAEKAGLIIFGSLASRTRATRNVLVKLLKNSKATRLLDVNLRAPYDKQEVVEPLLYLADGVKLNDEELLKIAGWNRKSGCERELINWLAEYYKCPVVCLTRGANGAALFMEDELYDHPGFKINAMDTVGAGDAFLAGLTAQLSSGSSPQDSLEFACATGAFVASQNGAVPDYSQEDISKLMEKT